LSPEEAVSTEFDCKGMKRLPFVAIDQRWKAAFVVSIGVFMSTLDASVVNISLPTITQALKTNLGAVAWVVMGYLVIITGCLLFMGRLADLFGQRKLYLLGFSVFTVASALCGFSPTIHFLIGSRMIQGLGGSALMAIGPAILATSFPDADRGRALGIAGSVVSAAFLTGPLLGGFLVEHLGWRSIFFVNLPIGAIGIFFSSKVLEKKERGTRVQMDLWGAFLLFLFLTFSLLFLNSLTHNPGSLLWGWLFLGLGCFGLFLAVELRSPSPLVDLHLFRERLFVSALGASLISFWMGAAHGFVFPFFLQNILGFSPSKAGMLIFPVSLTVMVMAPLGGTFSDRVGVRIPASAGLILISLTVFSFTLLKGNEGDYHILWRQVLLGIGIGLFNPANNSAIIGSLPREKIGLASSFLALVRNLGIMMGVALAEVIIAFRMPALSEAGRTDPTIEGIHDVWRLTMVLGLFAAVLSWTRVKLKRSGD